MTAEQKNSQINPAYFHPTSEELLSLVRQVQAGSEEARECLCRYFKPLVEATAKKFTFYTILGEDAVSIAWIGFLECVESFQPKKEEKLTPGYFQKVIYNLLLDKCEGQLKHTNSSTELDYNSLEGQQQAAEDIIITDIALSKALKTLKPKELRLIYLHYYENLTLKEIAALKKENPTKYWSLKSRVLKKLKTSYNS